MPKDDSLAFAMAFHISDEYRSSDQYKLRVSKKVAFWREHVFPTFIDQWPPEVHAMSVRTVMAPMPSEIAALKSDPSESNVRAFSLVIDQLRESFPGGAAFFKLSSRSPKDAWFWENRDGDRAGVQPYNPSSLDVARAFLWSERIIEDILDAQSAGYTPVVCAREWIVGCEPHREFRCFMKNRELVGISVYRAWDTDPKPQIVAEPARWEHAILAWFPRLLEAIDLSSVVFDVVVLDGSVLLLELNPFLGSTYPGHFASREMDGRFRYLGDGDSEVVE